MVKAQTQNYTSLPHIMVVDDDKRIRELVSRYLTDHGFMVITADNGQQALNHLKAFEVDALVVDIMMPKMNGLELTQTLRQNNQDTPILLLTALGEVDDRVKGFESGADDYLTKPFEPKELVLRLESILKRTKKTPENNNFFQIGKWHFDTRHEELTYNDEILSLTSVEANLLRALCQSAGEVVSREDLAQRCDLNAGERTIDVQVTRLRRKIEENTKTPRYLQTIRGKGYILRAERA